jgi:REP element-mobilizing transposase RayT
MVVTTSFHLPPPPGFRGLHPDLPIQRYERHLPHWRQEGATYFVTFRLADSLPQPKLQLLKQLRADWERTHPLPRSEKDWTDYAREVTTSVEHWLDEGYGACQFRQQCWCDELRSRLHHFQDQRYQLSCWTIMPNHCHAVMRPFEGYPLEDLVGSIKGVAARNINAVSGLSGQLWQDESFDRIVRDEEHLWRVIQYIGANPRKAGLAHENAWRRWIHPDWEAAGWRFEDP